MLRKVYHNDKRIAHLHAPRSERAREVVQILL